MDTAGPSSGALAVVAGAMLAVAAALPTHLSESGPVLCPSRMVTGLPCPGCGLVRGCTHAMHGDPAAAWAYNPFVFVVLPLAVYVLCRVVARWVKAEPMLPLTRLFHLPSMGLIGVLWLGWGVTRIVLVAAGIWPNIA